MRAEQQSRLGVGDQFAEVVGVFHRPAVGDVGVVLHGRDVRLVEVAQLVLGQADRRDLRIGEDGVGDRPQTGGAQVVAVEQVVRDGTGFGVGDMLELVLVADISERPDAGHARAQEVVGHDVAVGIHRDAGCVQIEQVAVRHAAGGDQQCVTRDLVHDAIAVQAQRDRPTGTVGLRDTVDARVHVALEAASVDFGEALADLHVLAAEHARAARRHHDRATEAGEHVGHLRRDVARTEHDESLGQRRQPHDRVARVVVDGVEAHHVGDERACAGRDHDVRTGQLLAVHLDGLRADEAGLAGEDRDVRRALPVGETARWDRVDAAEDAIDDVGPADLVDRRVDAVRRRMGDVLGDVGGVDEHLGRDAAAVEAGAAEDVLFDDRDPLGVVVVGEDAVPRPGTDDDDVKVKHRVRVSA